MLIKQIEQKKPHLTNALVAISLLLGTAALSLSLTTKVAFAGLKEVEIETAYQDDQGNLIVRFDYGSQNPKFFDTNLTFYGNQNGLYQQEETGFGGNSTRYTVGFYDPSGNGKFHAGVDPKDTFESLDEYRLVCGKKSKLFEPVSDRAKARIQDQIRSGKISLHSLPTSVRQTEYILKSKDNRLWVYVDVAKLNYSYESFRLFAGPLNGMKEYKIKRVERFRDGGTTYVALEDGGVLFSPTPFEKGEPAALTDASGKVTELEKPDRSFDLSQLGIKGVPTPEVALKTPCELLR